MDRDLEALKVETISQADAAKILGTSAPRIKAAILNGTMPVAAVFTKSRPNEVDRVTIIKKRFIAWLEAEDLKRK